MISSQHLWSYRWYRAAKFLLFLEFSTISLARIVMDGYLGYLSWWIFMIFLKLFLGHSDEIYLFTEGSVLVEVKLYSQDFDCIMFIYFARFIYLGLILKFSCYYYEKFCSSYGDHVWLRELTLWGMRDLKRFSMVQSQSYESWITTL